MRRFLRFTSLAVAAAGILASGACCSGTGLRTVTGASQAHDLSKKCLIEDVQVIVVMADGKTVPKDARAKKGVQVVVWVADADKLDLQFVSNPFPNAVTCAGRFCYSIQPPNAPAGFYDYTGTITLSGGGTKPIDPRIEIMN
jgi:hypothetical protein